MKMPSTINTMYRLIYYALESHLTVYLKVWGHARGRVMRLAIVLEYVEYR